MKLIPLFSLLIPVFSISQNASTNITDISSAAYKILHVGENPDFLAIDGEDAWVVDDNHGRIFKLSPDKDKPLLTVNIPGACTAPIVGFGAVWVMSCSEKKLYKADHNNGSILATIETGLADNNGEMSLATGDGSIWLLSDSTGVLARIDPVTNTIQEKIMVQPHSYCASFGLNAVWISNHRDNSVQRIDPGTNKVTVTIPVGSKPRFITASELGVWTLNQGDGTVSRIDPSINKVIATIDVKAPGGGGDICAGSKKVWVVSTNTERPVQTINPLTNKVETIYRQTPIDGKPFKVDGAVRISSNYVWVSGYHSKTVWVLKNKN